MHFWISTVSVNVLFFPQHFLGLAGMPRRIPDYSVQFTDWNMISSIGGFVFGVSQLMFAYVVSRRSVAVRRRPIRCGKVRMVWSGPAVPAAAYHSFTEAPPGQVTHRCRSRPRMGRSLIQPMQDVTTNPQSQYPVGDHSRAGRVRFLPAGPLSAMGKGLKA